MGATQRGEEGTDIAREERVDGAYVEKMKIGKGEYVGMLGGEKRGVSDRSHIIM